MSQVQQAYRSDPLVLTRPRRARPMAAVVGHTNAIRVYLFAKDAILRDGIAIQLRASPTVTVLDAAYDPDGVAVLITDDLQEDAIGAIAGIHRTCTRRIVVVAARMTPGAASAAHHAGAWCFLRRPEARTDRLLATVKWAAEAEAPRGVEAALAALGEGPHHNDAAAAAWQAKLSSRDVNVLRLVADGQSTATIAADLAYSESTIKNVIHDIVSRLGARNRAHAVALSIRAGVI